MPGQTAFQTALELKLVALIREVVPDIKTFFIGEPFQIPVKWMPCAVVFNRRIEPAEGGGYDAEETRVEHISYIGYLTVEALGPDTGLVGRGGMKRDEVTGIVVVPSYDWVKEGLGAVYDRLDRWRLNIDQDQLRTDMGLPTEEWSSDLFLLARDNGIEDRADNYTQRGMLEWRLQSTRVRQ